MKPSFLARSFRFTHHLILAAALFGATALSTIAAEVPKGQTPKIQIAILLDSSNSMDGLIDQTRQQIWNVVNALTAVRKSGQVPALEIALYQYGNDSLLPNEGFIEELTDFTPELDMVSERLFKIRTNGGQEYVGWVLRSALKELHWSHNPGDFRAVFVAGNEPFNQGQVPWQESVALAERQDTIVNTIYCGEAEDVDRQLWAKGAELAQGANFNINQDRPTAFVPSPFDDQIAQLNQSLNATYVPFGGEGTRGLQRQIEQDRNAGQQIVTRGASKSSSYYSNSSWDLIDALADSSLDLKTIPDNQLPQELRGLTLDQKASYLQQRRSDRQGIQAKIQELAAKRQDYLNHLPPTSPRNTVDTVIIQSLRQQLERKGFTF